MAKYINRQNLLFLFAIAVIVGVAFYYKKNVNEGFSAKKGWDDFVYYYGLVSFIVTVIGILFQLVLYFMKPADV